MRETELRDEDVPSQRRKAIYEIDLIDLARDIWGGRYLILCLLFLAFLMAELTVSFGTRTYTATMLVSSADQSGSQGLSGALSQVTGAANLLGIGLGGADNSIFTKYSAVLESYDLAKAILKHDELKPILFSSAWNSRTRTWQRPDGFIFDVKDFLKGLLGLPRWAPPTPFTTRAILKSDLHLTPDKQKGFLTISTTASSPKKALKLLDAVYMEADHLLRHATKERAQNRIDYLRAQLKDTTIQDQRTAIVNVLSVEEQRLMMASADKTVAIQIIDPPYAEPVPSSPQLSIALMRDAFLALVLGMLLSAIHGLRQRDAIRKADGAGIEPPQPITTDTATAMLLRRWLHRE